MQKEILKYSAGLDVSGDDFKACFSQIDLEQRVKTKGTRTFTNTPRGYNAFDTWLKKYHKDKTKRLTITVEATGVYHEKLAYFLYEKGYQLSVVLPTKSKKYLESIGLKSKTDKLDAKGLAQMGAEQRLDHWQPFSEHIYELKTLCRHRVRLQKMSTQIKNQIHAHEKMGYVTKAVVRQLKKTVKVFEKQLSKIEEEIELALGKDKKVSQRAKLIADSISGVGLFTVVTLIAETNGFHLFSSQSQLTSYAGFDIIQNQSGKRNGKTKMSKKGNKYIRKAMFFPALNVVRLNTGTFPSLYQRIFERTKIPMKGYVAVQRKLLCLIFALWKKDQAFNPNYHNPNTASVEAIK